MYGSELIVYDKHNRCLLTDGDYELGLQEVQTNIRSSPKKHSSWESVPDIKECGPFEVFSKGPTLKFRLNWTTEPSNGLVDRPAPIHPLPNGDNKENRSGNSKLFMKIYNAQQAGFFRIEKQKLKKQFNIFYVLFHIFLHKIYI